MSTNEKFKVIDILLVEDNQGDAELASEALTDSRIKNNLYNAYDGQEAMDFLQKKGKFKKAPKPDLIILDLNLPKKDGKEVLEEIKTDPELRRIPVVVLTTSDAEEDILKSYDLHANCYITKPLEFNKFVEVINTIEDFWLSIVILPKE